MDDKEISKNKRIDMKLLVRLLIIFLVIGILLFLVFGEQNVTRIVVIVFIYLVTLFYAMTSSLNLANSFSHNNLVFAFILIPRLIIFILLVIFLYHRMIIIDLLISTLMNRLAIKVGNTRYFIDEAKDLIRKEGE